MIGMYIFWLIAKGSIAPAVRLQVDNDETTESAGRIARLLCMLRGAFDMVDVHTVDLHEDEYANVDQDEADDSEREERLKGRYGFLWRMYYLVV